LFLASNYKNNKGEIPPLDLCERDGKLFENTLRKHGKYDEVKVFLGERLQLQMLKILCNI